MPNKEFVVAEVKEIIKGYFDEQDKPERPERSQVLSLASCYLQLEGQVFEKLGFQKKPGLKGR